jgi:putative ABC transport system substrate-binding protein
MIYFYVDASSNDPTARIHDASLRCGGGLAACGAGAAGDRLPALAADLVRRQVGLIFASLPAALAARASTFEIPIVFEIGANPIEFDLMASLIISHPGGNVTGVTNLVGETKVKRLQLLDEAVPAIKVVAAVVNPTEPNSGDLARSLEAAGRELGLEVHVIPVSTEPDYDNAFCARAGSTSGCLSHLA